MDSLHPYDGKTRRYSHRDEDLAEGLRIVGELLRLERVPNPEALRYEMSFFSGGIGVIDQVAICLHVGEVALERVLRAHNAELPAEAVRDLAWEDDFRWLIYGGDGAGSVERASAAFVNEEREEFQPQCRRSDRLWFGSGSNVNSWVAIWEHDGLLCFSSYDQG